MSLLISFLYLLLHIAVIIFVAFLIVWLLKFAGISIDAEVYKWGKVIVGLLIVIAIAVWIAGLVGYGPGYWPWLR